jgi:uncharacterized protein
LIAQHKWVHYDVAKRTKPTWKPGPEDFLQAVTEQNPWYTTGSVPDSLAFKSERILARRVGETLLAGTTRRHQLILGPRRVGKSTCMYQVIRALIREGVPPARIMWLRLDHPLLMDLRLDELLRRFVESAGATAERPAFVFLDELVYAESWDLWLKTFYDDQWPVRIVASSSSTAALREQRLESGVGRWDEQYLLPYAFHEYLALTGTPISIPAADTLGQTLEQVIASPPLLTPLEPQRRRYLLAGGFPELIERGKQLDDVSSVLMSQQTLSKDSIERAIYKDIPQAFRVEDPMQLERVLYALAGQVSQILSPQSLCEQLIGLSQPTLDRYIAYLERSFLVFLLSGFAGSEIGKQKRGRKVYFLHSAVRNAALQRGIGPLTDTQEMGLLMENAAAAHMFALAQHSGTRAFYWRKKDAEVDLILESVDRPLAFEIASSVSHHRAGLVALQRDHERFRGGCYLVAPDAPLRGPDPKNDDIGSLPLDVFLLAVGAQADRAAAARIS